MTKFGLALPKLPDVFFLAIHPDRWIWCVLFVSQELTNLLRVLSSFSSPFLISIPLESARNESWKPNPQLLIGDFEPELSIIWSQLIWGVACCSHWSTRHTVEYQWTIGDRQMDSRRCFKENLLACARWLYLPFTSPFGQSSEPDKVSFCFWHLWTFWAW